MSKKSDKKHRRNKESKKRSHSKDKKKKIKLGFKRKSKTPKKKTEETIVQVAKMGFFQKNDHQCTPKEFYKELDEEYNFDFDPCPLHGERSFDGLKIDWKKRNFVNPPYSNIPAWIEKGIQEKKKGNLSVFLITAKTQTKYWLKTIVPEANKIRFLKEGLCFGSYKKPFPGSIALVLFDPNSDKTCFKFVEKKTYSYFTANEQ